MQIQINACNDRPKYKPLSIPIRTSLAIATNIMTAKRQATCIVTSKNKSHMITDKKLVALASLETPVETLLEDVELDEMVCISSIDTIRYALQTMVKNKCSTVHVRHANNNLIGMVNLGTVLAILFTSIKHPGILMASVLSIIKASIACTDITTTALETSIQLTKLGITAICILSNAYVVGIVSSNDIVKRALSCSHPLAAVSVAS
jgi:CBS domain-containing protein